MKVLLVTNMYPTPSRPGYGIFVKEQKDAIERFCPDVRIDVYYIDKTPGNHVYLQSMWRVNNLIKRGGYDLVHIHYGLAGLFTLWPLRRSKVPVVITLHGGDIQPEQGKDVQVWLTHRVLRRVNMAIALNNRMTDLANAYCSIVAQIPCAIDTTLFHPGEGSRPALTDERLRVVFPSDRARVVKNFPLFEATVKRYTELYHTPIEIIELKNMSRNEVAGQLRSAHVMLLTSISEGSPQVVKEAMACNLPVVATKVGDVDTLLHGVRNSGWVDNPTAESMCASLRNVVLGKHRGKPGRERIFELGLDSESVAQRVYNVYNLMLRK